MTLIETSNAVLLLVGREEFTPPKTFGGAASVATHDCVAVAVGEGPTTVTLAPAPATTGLTWLGEFEIEAEGLLSLRDVWNKEYDAAGVAPGLARVTVWGDDPGGPAQVALAYASLGG